MHKKLTVCWILLCKYANFVYFALAALDLR